jgi:hypothetical protein
MTPAPTDKSEVKVPALSEEGWSRDVTQDIADELWERCAGVVPASLQDFLDRYPAKPKTQQLNLL